MLSRQLPKVIEEGNGRHWQLFDHRTEAVKDTPVVKSMSVLRPSSVVVPVVEKRHLAEVKLPSQKLPSKPSTLSPKP